MDLTCMKACVHSTNASLYEVRFSGRNDFAHLKLIGLIDKLLCSYTLSEIFLPFFSRKSCGFAPALETSPSMISLTGKRVTENFAPWGRLLASFSVPLALPFLWAFGDPEDALIAGSGPRTWRVMGGGGHASTGPKTYTNRQSCHQTFLTGVCMCTHTRALACKHTFRRMP
jgi:hypothetical protein